MDEQSNSKEALFRMEVEIGDGRTDSILVKESDEPELLAQEFAKEHNLDFLLQQQLTLLLVQKKLEISKKRSPQKPSAQQRSPQQPVQKTRQVGKVFNRLIKQSSPLKLSKSAKSINYGQWLYLKGVKSKAQQQEKIEEAKKHRKVETFSFTPTINGISHTYSPRLYVKTEDLLLMKNQEYKDKLKQRTEKLIEEEKKVCTFTPKIISKHSVSEVPRHEKLHSEAEKKEKRRHMLIQAAKKMCDSYYPNNVNKKVTLEDQEASADRLILAKKNYQNRADNARKTFHSTSGLFTPQILRRPGRKSETPSVFDKLYSKRDDMKQKVEKYAEDDAKHLMSVASSIKTCNSSVRMYDQLRGKQYAHLFTLLDSDNDGKVSQDAMSLDEIDYGTLKILDPLLKKIVEPIGIEQFVIKMERLWNSLTVHEKGIILKKRQAKTPEKSSERSQSRLAHSSFDIYERNLKIRNISRMKMEKQREIKEEQEIKGCTFRPSINDDSYRTNTPKGLYERHLSLKRTSLQRSQNERDIKAQNELKGCTFSPSINKESKIIKLRS